MHPPVHSFAVRSGPRAGMLQKGLAGLVCPTCHQVQGELKSSKFGEGTGGASKCSANQGAPLACSSPATQCCVSSKSFGGHGEVVTVSTGSCSASSMVSHPGLTQGSGSQGNISVHVSDVSTTEAHVRAKAPS